ncbi:phytanoyl-CoA dioxygenase family protein [Candidatus Poriferisodalis sp.]|uniref:phytanoyl-CoA dioxygenase family protein n=1 Tax=Candidatus Poriferisodalis sp. TaxID=3101277 RepID=UPI003B029704
MSASTLDLTHDEAALERYLAEVAENGYCIVEGAIEPELVTEVRDAVARVEHALGVQPKGNRIEGFATKRMYNLLGKDRSFWKLPIHRNVLPFPQRLMEPGAILSGTTCMHIGPGEVHQGLHSDDGLVDQIDVPRPRAPFMVTTIWALTDFTSENGATRLVPGSHHFDHEPQPGEKPSYIAAEMPAGSVLIVNGGTWHCGGANTSEDDWRLGISVQYCRGWMRQQQNQYYSLSPTDVQDMPEELAALCGFSLYRGIMGHVDGASPGRYLGVDGTAETAYAARIKAIEHGDEVGGIGTAEPVAAAAD